MVVVNQEGKIFLGERKGEPGIWQFPQGGVEPEFSLEDNVLRELEEELGAERTKFRIIRKLESTHSYEFRRPPNYAKGKWRGQAQTFWLVAFEGKDKDFDFNAHQPEFMNFKWCTIDEVHKFTDPIRLPGYQGALREIENDKELNSGTRSSKNKDAGSARRGSKKNC